MLLVHIFAIRYFYCYFELYTLYLLKNKFWVLGLATEIEVPGFNSRLQLLTLVS